MQQLSNKVQHVHRAYTAKDKKNHKAICDSFRENKNIDISEVLETLGTGEALVSFLDEKGAPNVVECVKILPPQSKMGTIDDDTRDKVIKESSIYLKYINDVDRESAYEILNKKVEESEEQFEKEDAKALKERQKQLEKAEKEAAKRQKQINTAIKSVARSTGSTLGRETSKALTESIFGTNNKTVTRMVGNIGSALGRNIFGTLLKE